MKKKKLWRDIKKCFLNSKGRFISIFCLMALGSFAIVGLKVAGPDMRQTGITFFNQTNLSDLTVIGDYGIDEDNIETIDQLSDIKEVEYGYLKDVEIKGTTQSLRVLSNPGKISAYELVSGNDAKKKDEIVLSNTYMDEYSLGDTISIYEKEDVTQSKSLKVHTFKIVGFAKSPEYLSYINMGQSTAGSGELNGFGYVIESDFDTDYYMLARITFNDLVGVDPYSDEYTDLIQSHKDELEELMSNQGQVRLDNIQSQYQEKIDDGQTQIDEAKQKISDTQAQLDDANAQIQEAIDTIASSQEQLDLAASQIASGQQTLDEKWDELESAKSTLDSAKSTLESSEAQLNLAYTQIQSADTQISSAKQLIAQNEAALKSAKSQISQKESTLSSTKQQLDEKQSEYDAAYSQYASKYQEYQEAVNKLDAAQSQLDGQKSALESGKQQYEAAIATYTQTITDLQAALSNPDLSEEERAAYQAQLDQAQAALGQVQNEYNAFMSTYDINMQAIAQAQSQIDEQRETLNQAKLQLDDTQAQLNAAKQELDGYWAQYNEGVNQLESAKQEISTKENELNTAKQTLSSQEQLLNEKKEQYNAGYAKYQSGIQSYNSGLTQYYAGLESWQSGYNTLVSSKQEYEDGKSQLASAKSQLASKQSEYQSALSEFNEKKEDAEKEISENETKLKKAQKTLNNLEKPVYALDTRRETPGSEGYKIYSTVSNIIDSLANVFPIFLYFVAALVTLTTMTRFVDEERMNSGTLKALGYSDRDVIKKFTVYGLVAGLSGTIVGIIAGHILIPMIVYNAYGHSFALPTIELHAYARPTIIALLLSLASSVLPAWVVSYRELQEKPSALLLPKPPAKGSKIFMERITPLWSRLSFTHKVTARNIFRYKKRMFMTIFGVCGSVTLLFAGLSVQHSISGINEKQFGEIIKYDMIVAKNSNLEKDEQEEIDSLLKDDAIKQNLSINYEALNITAGENNDKQEIKLIVSDNEKEFNKYIGLQDRKSGEKIDLNDNGAVISERLAKLLNVSKGDMFTVTDSSEKEHTVVVEDITEMYTGHFIFMNDTYYEKSFKKDFESNANLVMLKNDSIKNANKQACRFMELDGVKGVVQNTTLKTQVNTIVKSLNKIMEVLIIVAILLAIVILYNLTNINVAERIRELSTIKVLGFYNKEVTMYIYRETILLSILGILVGFFVGDIFYDYILAVVPPDEVMFNPALGLKAFLVPMILICLITFILGNVMNHKLKYLDMLSALKSVD